MINPMDLSGKTILVTGASSGMGRATCVTLSQLGAKVILVARSEEGLEHTRALMDRPEKHTIVSYDLRNLDGIGALVKRIVTNAGKLDGFVHSAGIGTMKPLMTTKPSFMNEMMTINLYSFVEIVRCISRRGFCNTGLSIVAISSAASIRGDKAKIAYCSSKGALDSAVQSLAAELGAKNKYRVNSVNPGWVNTEMFKAYVDAVGEEKIREIEERQFLGVTDPSAIASTIAFLISNASCAITGQSILVDGGRTIW